MKKTKKNPPKSEKLLFLPYKNQFFWGIMFQPAIVNGDLESPKGTIVSIMYGFSLLLLVI